VQWQQIHKSHDTQYHINEQLQTQPIYIIIIIIIIIILPLSLHSAAGSQQTP